MSEVRLFTLARRYPLVGAILLVGLLVAVLILSGQDAAAQGIASIFALAVALYRAGSMVKDLFRGRWGIDLLAITAIGATVVVGEYIAALVIVLMLTGGEALEDYAQGRATRELTDLLKRSPRNAHRVEASGDLVDIAVEDVNPGDVLLVKPAETVPVDGELLSEAGSFDESALTGESLPVERSRGGSVLSGTVNGPAAVRIKATATAKESQYSQIVALVQEAAASRAPTVRLADRYAIPFTVVAFAMAGVAWFISGDPVRFVEVLVVATPCPLLIAAPVAFLAGTSRAAKAGVIIKNAGTLEQLSKVRTAVFDKTGTLTAGKPTLVAVRRAGSDSPGEETLLQLAASAEQFSSHVFATSVMASAAERGLPLLPSTAATEHATNGVAARVGNHDVVVGKAAFVREQTTGFEHSELAGGQLAIYVGVDGRYAGTLIMSDPLRVNAVDTLGKLRELGVRESLLLTGDAESTARSIAAQAGMETVLAECLPGDKVRAVAGLKTRPVMMVGDGVNDAPVLAAADVGIAMGARGATAASESADVVILLDDLSTVAVAVDVGQYTLRIARTSIWTGILLSLVLMVFASWGFIVPVAGALLQELVDLATILNALRALGKKQPRGSRPEGAGPSSARVRPPAQNAGRARG
jgi:heavy metal translocating P-type ATPase